MPKIFRTLASETLAEKVLKIFVCERTFLVFIFLDR